MAHPEYWRALDIITNYGGLRIIASPPMEQMCDDLMAMVDQQVAAERTNIYAKLILLSKGGVLSGGGSGNGWVEEMIEDLLKYLEKE